MYVSRELMWLKGYFVTSTAKPDLWIDEKNFRHGWRFRGFGDYHVIFILYNGQTVSGWRDNASNIGCCAVMQVSHWLSHKYNVLIWWFQFCITTAVTSVCAICKRGFSARCVFVCVCWMHKHNEMCTGLSSSEYLALLHSAALSVTVMGKESRG